MPKIKDDNTNNGHGENGNGEHGYIQRFGALDSNAIDPAHPGQMYFGNGNLATGYNIADNVKEHVELGLKVHERGGAADQTPTSDSHQDPTYNEMAGLQDARPGHERAMWNFDYSVDTALGGGKATLDSFDFKITVSNATHTETFDLAKDGSHVWISETNPAHFFGGDDFNHPASGEVQATEAENSVNIGFGAFEGFGSLAARTGAGQHYEVTLEAFSHNQQIALVHDYINVV